MFKKSLSLFVLLLFATRIFSQYLPADNTVNELIVAGAYDAAEESEESKGSNETGEDDDSDFELLISSSSTLLAFNQGKYFPIGKYLPPSFKRQSPPPEFC